jgi:hypothetical protein
MVIENKSGAFLGGLLMTMMFIVSIINISAGIIGGIWILLLGQWSMIVQGILYGIISPFILGMVLVVGLIFGGPGMILLEKRKYISGYLLLLLSSVFDMIIIFVSVMYIFGIFASMSLEINFIPVLLFAYAVSFSPWSYMAQKDASAGNGNSKVQIIWGQIGFLLGLAFTFFTGIGVAVNIGLIAGLLFGGVLNWVLMIEEIRYKKLYE